MSYMVFVSHKRQDLQRALQVAQALEAMGLTSYLDGNDSRVQSLQGEPVSLTNHLNTMLLQSATLLAVISEHTQESWWVPYEIGYLRAMNRPVATYGTALGLPAYLVGWPRLTSATQWAHYVTWVKTAAGPQRDLLEGVQKGYRDMSKVAGMVRTAQELEDDLRVRLARA